MNSAVLEVAQSIADGHSLSVREVVARFRKVGVEFRTESNPSVLSDHKGEQVLLGYAYQGFFYPYTDENKSFLDNLIGDYPKLPEEPKAPPPEKAEKAADKGDKADKAEKAEKPDKAEKSEKPDKSEK
jgi:hypothetical protein